MFRALKASVSSTSSASPAKLRAMSLSMAFSSHILYSNWLIESPPARKSGISDQHAWGKRSLGARLTLARYIQSVIRGGYESRVRVLVLT